VAEDRRFNGRSFIALLAAFSFLVMVVTGVVLYVEPHGRVAYWTDWRLLGLGKQHWDGIHIVTSLVFLVASALHIYLNWKVLLRYLGARVHQGSRRLREMAVALVLVALVAAGAAAGWQPFKALLDLNETIKASWAETKKQPPFGHAELHSISSLCDKLGLDTTAAMAALRAQGIEVNDPSLTVKQVADDANKTPHDLFRIMRQAAPAAGRRREGAPGLGRGLGRGSGGGGRGLGDPRPGGRLAGGSPPALRVFRKYSGRGLGKQTIASLCAELGLPAEAGVQALYRQGIEASADQPIRTVAARSGLRPVDLLAALCRDGGCK